MSATPQICKFCGTENPADVLFCLICGKDLAGEPIAENLELGSDLTEPSESPEKTSDLPDFIRNLHEEIPRTSIRRSSVFEETSNDEETPPEGDSKEDEANLENTPEWLQKIRERAHTEVDATGDLIKKVSARDNQEGQAPPINASSEFEGWLGQVRKSAQRDTVPFQEGQDDQQEDEIPAWLVKVRESEGKLRQGSSKGTTQENGDPNADPGWVPEGANKEDELIQSTEPTQAIRVTSRTDTDQSTLPEDRDQPAGVENKTKVPEKTDNKLNEVTRQLQITPSDDVSLPEPKARDENVVSFWDEIAKNPVSAVIKEQYSRAELFKSLVAVEGQLIGRVKAPQKKSPRAVKVILAFLLIIVVGLPFLFGISNDNDIGSLPISAQAFMKNIDSLDSSSKVLLVVDYAVSMSAEMEKVAVPVIIQLTEMQAEVSVLSSYPEGAWLAKRLITFAMDQRPEDSSLKTVSYLGFLPGGRLGLYSLAQSNPSSIFSGFIEQDSFASGINLEEYDQMIIFVDSLQTARNWIELVGTHLTDSQINMVSSTQEAAMLLPYYDSGQIKGLVSGLYESRLYQASIPSTPQTGSAWLSYQVGLLFMIGLMLLGIVIRLESSGERNLKEMNHEPK